MALDPLPLILDDREWASLEAGLVQRAELLDAILADLYGARRLLARGLIPAAAIFDHDEYLRPLVGSEAVAHQRLFLMAADLGRDSSGQWKVISDRTQAPSGAGYAMQNRRVVSRVIPEIITRPICTGSRRSSRRCAWPSSRRRPAQRGPACRAEPAHTSEPPSTRPSLPPCSAFRCSRVAI